VAGHVERYAKTLGMELVLRVPYSFRTADVTTELTKVKAAKPDVVIVTGYFGDGLLIARTATEIRLGTKAVMGIANGGFSNPKFLADQRELADLILDGNYWHNPRSERAGRVMDAYQKRFNAPMSSHAVQAYSGTLSSGPAARIARRSARRWPRRTSPTTSCPRGRSTSTRLARTPTPSPPSCRTRAARRWSSVLCRSPRPRPSFPSPAGRAERPQG
jgi:hypothetical protein